ncbi:SDR family oxidoreductase [Paraburkholderia aspalathi]|uniref:3-oxoacyl-[acyl-carrier protein] reductase n=1 Tax=Paraburkholderia aspalathi TaxID=1324617 RepID=A0A1I7DBV7_9BURK|nr:SDR family oxidoreductase [Paraburkholderia aspalathi]SFU09147.1 3-oxoacyl-[acyl-carrier protein] reductase [Paraburkholderia aspalathi]
MRFSRRTVIVTGAASGYGAGIAARFAGEGANVVVADLNADNGLRVTESIQSDGGNATFVRADVSNMNDVTALLSKSLDAYGSVHAVINNAGTTHRRKPLCDVTEEEFDRLFSVNVKSLLISAKVMVPYFRSVKAGVFVNVASIVSFRPPPGLAWYAGSKAAVVNISRAMAAELGPDNIRVNCVNPAVGDTGLLAEFMGEPDTPELRTKYASMIPLGRFTTPDDVAGACLYLASDDARFVTGTSIDVDGGRSV